MRGDDTDPELEKLRRQTEKGSRVDEAAEELATADLREAIREELRAIDEGDRQKTVSVWDGEVAALVAALEDNAEWRQEVGEALRAAHGQEDVGGEVDRSEILRLALRLGFREASPEAIDTLREAVRDEAARGI